MKQINDISEELKSMESSLAGMSRKTPYSIPFGYFESLGYEIHEMIKNSQQPDPAMDWGKQLLYSVPPGYFEKLASEIISSSVITTASERSPAPMPFDIPSKYFESFPEKVLLAAKANEPAKKESGKIPLKQHNIFTRVRWAAAAIILICISSGSYITFFNNNQPANSEKILASVPESDIQEYLQSTYLVDMNRVMTNNDISNMELDNKDIVQYLNETGWDATE